MQELAVLASRVLTTQRRFTAVSDNIANVNTQGFRKLELEFKESVSRPGSHATASYVDDRAIHISTLPGAMVASNSPLDAAISGDGFFAIDVEGTTHYTRRGQFVINAEGTLSTPEGYPVLDNAGAQIQFPQGVTQIRIAADATISTEQGQLAQLGVFNFSPEDIKKLERAGDTAFIPMMNATALPVENPSVKQGFLEGSNVNAVTEMVNMQAVTQAYQSSVKMMKGLEDLESRAIRSLGNGS
ncbi:MAG: flagellar hook-basal body complex protein [Alphaproteobacteria bacterium]|nr:MAG: flagellar hook-basal body complex protein [Alphaproteobacteria bacterium]